ncbi:MAG: oligosaccharide flippase family protein [Planctomycetota bacterium]|jgi:PST family polysaccharide transporter
MTDLSRIAARGVAWTAGAALVRLLVRLGALVVLARELGTEEFGLAVLVLAITAIAIAGSDFGMGVVAVQRREVDEKRALRFALLGGLAAAVVLWLIAPLLGPLGRYVQVAALALPPAGAATALRARLARRLAFSDLALFDALLAVILAGGQIVFALQGHGAWSVVWAEIGTAVAGCVIWMMAAPSAAQGDGSLSADGLRVVGTRAADLIGDRLDRLILGARLGPTAVGYYGFAFQHAFFVPLQAGPIAEQVGLPVLSRLQDDRKSLVRTYLDLTRAYALMIVAASVLLYLLAPALLASLYPERWQTAVWPLRILCVGAACAGLNSQPGLLWLALGRVRLRLVWSLLNAPLLFAFVWVGSRWGVVGVSTALTIRHALATIATQEITRRVAGVPWSGYLRAVAPALALCALFLL